MSRLQLHQRWIMIHSNESYRIDTRLVQSQCTIMSQYANYYMLSYIGWGVGARVQLHVSMGTCVGDAEVTSHH